MGNISATQWLVLNSTSDDFENLEQIYRSVCLEFSSKNYDPSNRESFYWREAEEAVPLADIIDAIRYLVHEGLLSVQLLDGDVLASADSDSIFL